VDVSDVTGRDPQSDFEIILNELASFSEELPKKPMLVVASKVDAAQDPDRIAAVKAIAEEHDMPFLQISSATGEGLEQLKFMLASIVHPPKVEEPDEAEYRPFERL
jgi:GTP-binding protein